jgi:ribosome biogenesis protein MAK21
MAAVSDAELKSGIQAIFQEFGHTPSAVGASGEGSKRAKKKPRQRKPKQQPDSKQPSEPKRPAQASSGRTASSKPVVEPKKVDAAPQEEGGMHASQVAAMRRKEQQAAAFAMAGQGNRITFDEDSEGEEAVAPVTSSAPMVEAEVVMGKRHEISKPSDAAKEGAFVATGYLGSDTEGHPWYDVLREMEQAARLKDLVLTDPKAPPGGLASDAAFATAQQSAAAAFEADVARRAETYARTPGQGGGEWLKRVLERGTWSDKVTALSLLVAEAPVQNLAHLDTLVGMARRPSRRDTTRQVLTALRDLFVEGLLPSERKLVPFHSRQLKHAVRRPGILALWHFEDLLKNRYAAYLAVLQSSSGDPQSWFRRAVLQQAFDLLSARPEGEGALLGLIVNKLGDPDRKTAAMASKLLMKLLQQHPAMQGVVVRELRQFLARPSLTPRAKYQAVTTLSQFVLSRHRPHTALALVATYFDIIASCLHEESSEDAKSHSKLLGGALTGVNRAFPFAKPMLFSEGQAADSAEQQTALASGWSARDSPAALRESLFAKIDEIFRVVHTSSLATSIQALNLLLQVMRAKQTLSDRYFRALYAKIHDPVLRDSSTKHSMFLTLVYRSLLVDDSRPRQRAILKRLAQSSLHACPSFAAGVLILISKIHSEIPELARELTDAETIRHGTAGQDAQSTDSSSSSSSDEEDEDDSSSSSSSSSSSGDEKEAPAETNPPQSSSSTGTPRSDGYDPTKREPKFANADQTCLWEIALLASHFHPIVRKLADALLSHPQETLTYSGDPLADLSIMAFLDRFSYRNPKKLAQMSVQGVSGDERRAMEYMAASGHDTSRLAAAAKGKLHGTALQQRATPRTGRVAVEAPVTSSSFQSLPESAVRDDEMFLHRYFKLAARAKKDQERAATAGGDKAVAKALRVRELAEQLEEEAGEEDAFAQALAESLLNEADADGEDDIDDFAYSDDDKDDDKDDSDEEDDEEDVELTEGERKRLEQLLASEAASLTMIPHVKEMDAARASKRSRVEDDDEEEEDEDDEDDDEDDDDEDDQDSEEDSDGKIDVAMGEESDDDDEDDGVFAAMVEESDEEEERPVSKRKEARNKRKELLGAMTDPSSAFADLGEFLDQMDAADEQYKPDVEARAEFSVDNVRKPRKRPAKRMKRTK